MSGRVGEEVIIKLDSVKWNPEVIFKNKTFRLVALFVFSFVLLTLILSWEFFPTQSMKEGVVANREILASRNFEVIDQQATTDAKNKALMSVQPVYKVDIQALNELEKSIKNQFQLFAQIREKKIRDEHLDVKNLKSQLPIALSDSSLKVFSSADSETLEQLEIITRDLVWKVMQNPIREGDMEGLKQIRQQTRSLALGFALAEDQKKAVAELASEFIRPNAKADWEETSRQRQLKKESVRPVKITIQKGQVIIEKGKIVTPQQIAMLEAMGLQRSDANLPGITGSGIFALITIIVIWFFVKENVPEVVEKDSNLLLITIIFLFTAFICRCTVQINPYLAPVPMASLMLTVLIKPRVSLIVTVFLAMIAGIFTEGVPFMAVALITGIVASLSAYGINRRLDLVVSSIIICIINVVSVSIFALMNGETAREVVENLVYGGINGFLSGILVLGLLPVLENAFGITTKIKLLELSNQSETLMRRLLLEAPGTYHHSIIVGNLAEAAAESVGADPLLCRVGSYYHDIGKLKRPYFFIENQLGSENPHDNISPHLSAYVIISHVKDGMELGKKHKLPEPILNIISQHHGTSMARYFYMQAIKSAEDLGTDYPNDADFQYSGPPPASMESAIVMLADQVEAAARTLDKPTPQKIEELVHKIIKNNLDDNQLDNCPLSLKNITDMVNAFTRVITGIYHHRIEYPEKIIEEIEPRSAKIFPFSIRAK